MQSISPSSLSSTTYSQQQISSTSLYSESRAACSTPAYTNPPTPTTLPQPVDSESANPLINKVEPSSSSSEFLNIPDNVASTTSRSLGIGGDIEDITELDTGNHRLETIPRLASRPELRYITGPDYSEEEEFLFDPLFDSYDSGADPDHFYWSDSSTDSDSDNCFSDCYDDDSSTDYEDDI